MKKQTSTPLTEKEARAGLVLMRTVLSHVPSYVEKQAAKFAKEPRPSYGECGTLNSQQGFSLLRRPR